ncbi:MAG: hypothetical protein JWN61_570 [Pseudonocardiales bacterium]|jgi:predicted enzyme related to lactoylglutathione lyase|nr:hypothetical protein [Pseudonocardiales bacterium]
MASGVATVWVPVTDMARAVRFYTHALGLTLLTESDDWSEIDGDGVMIGLNAREAVEVDGGGAVITFQPDVGIDQEVARLKSEGIEFEGGISTYPWGRIAAFKDSEGNDLQLYAPPS